MNRLTIGTGTDGDTINIGTGLEAAGTAQTINIGYGGGSTPSNSQNIFIGNTTATSNSYNPRIFIGTGSNNTRVVFKDFVGTGASAYTDTNGQFIIGGTGGTTTVTNGRIWWRSNGVNYRVNSSGANGDYSEYLQQEDTSEPGDVMVFSSSQSDSVKRSIKTYDEQSVGVVTTSGTGGNNDADSGDNRGTDPHWTNVGMLGHIYTKVSTQNGNISLGDPLTTSSTQGTAMKATKAGRVIGYALEPYNGTPMGGKPSWFYWDRPAQNAIVALIQPGWYDPGSPAPPSLADAIIQLQSGSSPDGSPVGGYGLTDESGRVWDNVIAASQGAFANLKVGGLEVQKIVGNEADLSALQVSANGINLSVKDGQLVLTDTSGQPLFTVDSQGNAFLKGVLTAEGIQANEIQGLDIMAQNIVTNTLSTMALSMQSTGSAQLGNVLGVTDLAVNGGLTASGSSTFVGQTIFQAIVTLFNDLIVKGNTIFQGRVTVNSDTAGQAVIPSSTMSVDVPFDKPYDAPPIVTISLELPQATDSAFLSDAVKAAVANVTNTGFTIVLDSPVPRDLTYNWVALAVTNPRRVVGQGLGVTLTPTPTIIRLHAYPDTGINDYADAFGNTDTYSDLYAGANSVANTDTDACLADRRADSYTGSRDGNRVVEWFGIREHP